MEAENRFEEWGKKEIVLSKTVKAGKRVYYIDVKKNRAGELYLSMTESKKIVSNEGDVPSATFERHKIFVYREDLEKLASCINEAIAFIEQEQGKAEPRPERQNEGIELDIEF